MLSAEEHSSEATKVMLYHPAPSHTNLPSGPQPPLRSNDLKLCCLPCAPTMSLWLADASVLQWKTNWAWKETVSLPLDGCVFSTSLSHQWIYEPGEEFPETRCHVMIPPNMTLGEREKTKGRYHLSSDLGTFSQTTTNVSPCVFITDSIFWFSFFSLSSGNTDFIYLQSDSSDYNWNKNPGLERMAHLAWTFWSFWIIKIRSTLL